MDIWILSLGLLGIMSSWTFVYMFLHGYIFISLGYVLRSGIRLYGMLVFCGCLTNYHEFRGLENQKCFLEAGVQNEGVSRAPPPFTGSREASFLTSPQLWRHRVLFVLRLNDLRPWPLSSPGFPSDSLCLLFCL